MSFCIFWSDFITRVVAAKGPFEKKRIEKNLNEICETAHRLFPEGPPALCIFHFLLFLDGCLLTATWNCVLGNSAVVCVGYTGSSIRSLMESSRRGYLRRLQKVYPRCLRKECVNSS